MPKTVVFGGMLNITDFATRQSFTNEEDKQGRTIFPACEASLAFPYGEGEPSADGKSKKKQTILISADGG